MKYTIEIDCGNAAFDGDPKSEIARILKEQARKLEHWIGDNSDQWHDSLYDINGNKVGFARIEE